MTEIYCSIYYYRCQLLHLNSNKFNINDREECVMCNMHQEEIVYNFSAFCPILAEYREAHFGQAR